ILAEKNVDVRALIIKKIGIEKTIEILGATVLDTMSCDKGGDYELLMVDLLGRGNASPYLKMKNRSVDAWHIEGVSKSDKTVEDAHKTRYGFKTKVKYIKPEHIS